MLAQPAVGQHMEPQLVAALTSLAWEQQRFVALKIYSKSWKDERFVYVELAWVSCKRRR